MSDEPRIFYTNRTVCEILADFRKCWETRNFSYMMGILEELQWYAEVMESNLQNVKDVRELKEERHNLKAEVFALREELAKQRLLRDKMCAEDPACEDKPVMTNEEWIEENLKDFTGADDEYPEAWEDVMLGNAQ
jgi:hypothetical protein